MKLTKYIIIHLPIIRETFTNIDCIALIYRIHDKVDGLIKMIMFHHLDTAQVLYSK